MNVETKESGFSPLGAPRRIWAVSAVHAQAEQLISLHDALHDRIAPGDRLIYLGNYTGHGETSVETVSELLTFRRMVLARPGMAANDIVYLRGGQEEMWNKLLQIPFSPDPRKILEWMLSNGLSATLRSYGVCAQEGIGSARDGVMALVKWTAGIRDRLRRHPGHDVFTTQWRRAAYTAEDSAAPLLFVNAGLNPDRPLHDQGDSFWWAGHHFNDIHAPYAPFQKIIRGYDPAQGGVAVNGVTATIDGGCGFGGALVCAGFLPDGDLFDLIEA